MKSISSTSNQSPLDQIYLAESEVALKIAAARKQAEKQLNEVQKQTRLILKQAREANKRAIQEQSQNLIANAEKEARQLILRAKKQSLEIRQKGAKQINPAIDVVVSFVTDTAEKRKDHDT